MMRTTARESVSITTITPEQAASASVNFLLNGRAVEAPADRGRSLLDVLRNDFGCISLKNGCEPQASCGCCTLLIDGQPRLACVTKPSQVSGKDIVTLEGLPDDTRRQLAESFVRCGGVQCGFCIPGMAMRGVAITNKSPHPERDEI